MSAPLLKRESPCTECGSTTSEYWRTHPRCSWKCERIWADRQEAADWPEQEVPPPVQAEVPQ